MAADDDGETGIGAIGMRRGDKQEDDRGNVWAIYTDFAYIAKRHGITNRDAQFTMASGVVQSITSTVKAN